MPDDRGWIAIVEDDPITGGIAPTSVGVGGVAHELVADREGGGAARPGMFA
jgi:hypothetical protein